MLLGISLLVVLLAGSLTWYLVEGTNSGTNPPTGQGAQSSVSSASSAGAIANVPLGDYGCTTPAINSYLTCDRLPAGYHIAPRGPNVPPPFCPNGMSASACALLKQTQSNGVCDPNETALSDPLDCGCSGNLVVDPYLGRCSQPAAVCQIVLNNPNG